MQILSWNLRTGISAPSGQDVIDVLDVQNPLNTTSLAQIGPSFNRAEFDYSWLISEATGTFHTTFRHILREPDVRAVSDGKVRILADEPLRLTLTGSLAYSHTAGDEVGINFDARVRTLDPLQTVLLATSRGGNLYLEPSFGTLTLNAEIILDPNVAYEFSYGVDSQNQSDLPPTGPVTADGWMQWTIEPVVPEPATLAMLLLAAPWVIRRTR